MANTTIGKSMFSGVVLLTPYYRLNNDKLYEAHNLLIPLTNIRPNHVFMSEFAESDPEYMETYRHAFEDPTNLNFFTAMTARFWIEEQEKARVSV